MPLFYKDVRELQVLYCSTTYGKVSGTVRWRERVTSRPPPMINLQRWYSVARSHLGLDCSQAGPKSHPCLPFGSKVRVGGIKNRIQVVGIQVVALQQLVEVGVGRRPLRFGISWTGARKSTPRASPPGFLDSLVKACVWLANVFLC